MSERPPPPTRAETNSDRLDRVAAMLNNAVALLNDAMTEIKEERGIDDDGHASGQPDRDPHQPW